MFGCSIQAPDHHPRVALIVERQVESKTSTKGGRAGVKRRDMNLPDNKKDQLCAVLKSKRLWSWDEDWPNDEEDMGVLQWLVWFKNV